MKKIIYFFQIVGSNHKIIEYYGKFYRDLKTGKDSRGGSNKKYYIIIGETFKKMCMRANTTKGNETCDYFIKVESLLIIIMSKYLMERIKFKQQKQLQEKEKLLLESKEAYERQQKELEEAKQKNLNLRTIIKNTQIHDYDGYLYFVTNRQYSLENHYSSFF